MTNAEMRSLFDFNEWANARTFEAVGALTPEQLTHENGSSFPSILLTAAHIVGAEWIWLERWLDRATGDFPAWVLQPDLADLQARLRVVEAERAQYLAALPEGGATSTVAFKLRNGTNDRQPVAVMVRHVVNHSTYHRGQIAAFIRQFGVTPPSTDYITFARARRA
jgi:uncharacterized damage-inducible protein DinB